MTRVTQIIKAKTVVAAGEVHSPGWLAHTDGQVLGVGAGNPRRDSGERAQVPVTDLGEAVVVPGFVDIHVHGGGGGAFTGPSGAIEQTIATHRARGTTAMCASLVSAHPRELRAQVERLAAYVERGELLGVHLEGPWLSPAKRGAHDPSALRPPELDEVRSLLEASRGTIRMVTVAPELPGALEAIELLHRRGVVAAIGHTDATYAQTQAAIDAGATVATHLFNAMRPINHREPGPIIALTEDERVVVEVIADGVHVHPAVVDRIRQWVGRERLALVTDAMAATEMPDGAYELGALEVTVTDGIARLTHGDSIAGGTATTDVLFRAAAGAASLLDRERLLDREHLLDAVAATSGVPLQALGLTPRDLSAGAPADLVVLTPELTTSGVMAKGEWVTQPHT